MTDSLALRLCYAAGQMQSPSSPPSASEERALHGGYESEAAFIEGLRNQETPAFEEMCRRHFQRVRVMLFRVLGHDAEAQDVGQEVIIRALSSAPKFRGDSTQLEGWITKIAIYTARDTIRKRQVFRRFFSSKEVDADESPAHLASVEQREIVKHTQKALRMMSADDRIAFSLRIIDQMSMDQVAAACGISLSTAKRRVDKARKKFESLASRDPALRELLGGQS